MAVAHVAVNFIFRNKSRNRVHNHNVHSARTHKGFGDFQSLFAVIRLRNKQGIDIDAERLGVDRVKGMLCVNERRLAAKLLNLGNNMQRHRRFTRRFRAVNFNDSSARHTADSERHIQRQRPCRNRADIHGRVLAKLHN